jgi:hypothetical protein
MPLQKLWPGWRKTFPVDSVAVMGLLVAPLSMVFRTLPFEPSICPRYHQQSGSTEDEAGIDLLDGWSKLPT